MRVQMMHRMSRRPWHLVLAAGFLIGTAGLAAATPATAQTDEPPRVKCVRQAPLYLHGDGTFRPEEPSSDPVPSVRLVNNSGFNGIFTEGDPPERLAWIGDMSGQLCGSANMSVYVAGLSPDTQMQVQFSWGSVIYGGGIVPLPDPDPANGGVLPRQFDVRIPLSERQVIGGKMFTEFGVCCGINGHRTPYLLFYGTEEYPSRFAISAFEPCGSVDAHPDCQLVDLESRVKEFAVSGAVSTIGEVRLLNVINLMPAAGWRATSEGISTMELFRERAADSANVPDEAARLELVADADRLIAALRDEMDG